MKVTTPAELKSALELASNTQDKMVFIEVVTEVMDIPPLLEEVAAFLQ